MSKLKKCLSKIKGVFSKQEEALMYSTEEKYAKEGEVEAATKAILNMHSRLNTELNKLKVQAGLKPSEHVMPITKQAEKEVNDKYDALEKEAEQKAKKEAVDAAEKEAKDKKIKEEKEAKEKKEAEKKVIDVGAEVKPTEIKLKQSDKDYLIDKGYDNTEINRAEKEANRILGLPVLEMFKELQKKGIFNLGRGEKMDGRPDLGLDKTNYNNTLRQLEQGKTTVTVKKLIDFLNQIKKDGTIPMVFDTGGMAEHNNIPLVFQLLGEGSGQQVGLSEEQEKEELEKEEARKKYEEDYKGGAQYQKPKGKEIKLKYDDKGRHLAPNGKPSLLTEEQAKLVRTPEFKKWFGDWENDPKNASKVIDKNGEPLVVYHGTRADFSIFDKKTFGSNTIKGDNFYFTPDKRTANMPLYTSHKTGTKEFLSVENNITKTFDKFLTHVSKKLNLDKMFILKEIWKGKGDSYREIINNIFSDYKTNSTEIHGIKFSDDYVLANNFISVLRKFSWNELGGPLFDYLYAKKDTSISDDIEWEKDVLPMNYEEDIQNIYNQILDTIPLGNNSKIHPVFLNVRDLYVITNDEYHQELTNNYYSGDEGYFTFIQNEFSDKVRDDYYDGGYSETVNEYVVHDPKNIKLANGTNKTFSQETSDIRHQKSSSKSTPEIQKVVDVIKKALPKFTVKYDDKLNAAGKIQGSTITINPNYAGIDTPIHEAGHALIDAIGYNNKVIQSAIKQLKTSPLWAETKERYKKLNEEMLGKEVLAEAIGREGAGIFDKEVDKSKFKVFLEYIYNKLKQLIGIDKNIAKSLAKQIIGGIGTKELTGNTEEAQFAKKKSNNEILDELTELVELLKERSVEEIPYEELSALYSAISNAMANEDITGAKGERLLSTVKKRMALNLKSRSTENDRKATEQQIKYKDISWYDKFFKVLSHFGDAFPDMKYLSSLYDSAFLKKVKEAEQYKHTHAKLAKDVVTEKHKQLGIVGRVKEFISNPILNLTTDQKHKYFKFLDNNGKVITVDEAKKKGYSEAQIKYVEFVREIMAKAMNIKSSEAYNADMDVIKLNKGLGETFQTEGLISGIAAMMTADKFNNIRIKFTNPVTGKDQVAEFKTVKSIISNYGKSGGLAEKAKAARALVKYTSEVNRQFKKEQHYDGGRENWPKNAKFQPRLDPSGKIPSRFGEERGKGNTTYTTDFYSVVNELIDDYTHVKNMSDLVPIVSSLEYLASKGLTKDDDSHKKNNLAKWFELWEKQHLFRVPDENSKGVDYALRKIRWLTSATRMMFNVSAQGMNIITGQLGNIFDMPVKDYFTGVKRMTTNYKYTLDLIDKYHGIEIDKTSNPLRSGMSFISDIGFAGLKWGEVFNQGIGIAGRLTEEEYNAFKYKKNDYGVDELVVKDQSREAKLEKTIQGYIKEVSDIHGKYGEKDRRNVMNNQWGQATMQFRVWLPDWLRVRFGDQGRYSRYWQGAISEMKESVRKNGVKQTFWNDKKFMSALKELAVIGFTLSMVYQDDDDDDKSLMSALYQRTLSELLAVFDFNSAKFTITHPVAAIGTVEKMIDMADHLIAVEADDFYKGKSTWGDKGDSKVRGDVMNFVPGKTAIKYAVDEAEEE